MTKPRPRPVAGSKGTGRPVGIFVLGMHRSGTSVLTRILNLLGCALPGDLLGSNESNPTGHWESARAIEINDTLLSALGRRWDDVRELPADWQQRPEAEAARQQIRALLDREFSSQRLWLLKEPRVCRLAPLWLEVARDMGVDTRVIIPVRHPGEVSYSLARRDGIGLGRGQLLWFQHLAEAEQASRGQPRVLVYFDAVIADWRGQTNRIGKALGIAWPEDTRAAAASIEAFIKPQLLHAHAEVIAPTALAPPVSALYQELLGAEGDKAWALIARVRQAIDPVVALFAPVVEELSLRKADLAAKLTESQSWPLTGHQLEQLRHESQVILSRIDQTGPLVQELIRQVEGQRSDIREGTFSVTADSQTVLAKLEQADPLLAELVRQIEIQRHEIEERLSALAWEREANRALLDPVGPLLKELTRQVDAQRSEMREEAARSSTLVAELGNQLEAQRREHAARFDPLLQQLASSRSGEADLRAVLASNRFESSDLKANLVATQAELASKQLQVAELLASTSWKLTRPVRGMRRLLAGQSPSGGPANGGLLKSTYRALPMPWSLRLRIKSWLFRAFSPVLKNTDAYRRWLAAGQHRPMRGQYAPSALVEVAPATTATASVVVAGKAADYAALASDSVAAADLRAKAIAFYLPQFHPVPENDRWWGRGFTEWANVSKALPQFAGHEQPKLPGELGFYDLRLPEVMRRQIELAKQYGIHGFCFHYYWFDGRRILERPLDQFLADPSFDFPFCVCWANENWTRRWDGHDDDILLGQTYSPDGDRRFIEDVAPILRDPRCIRIDGRPMLVVYRPSLLPDSAATVACWRKYCREAGIGEIFLAMVQFDVEDPRPFGFDAAVEFPPHKLARDLPSCNAGLPALNPAFAGYAIEYQSVVERAKNWPVPAYDMIRGVFPGWDNEARKPQQGYMFVNASPARYRDWLASAVAYSREHPVAGEAVVFINAWNEWAEGAYLEPDSRHGYAYLQATSEALTGRPANAAAASRPRVVVVSHDAHPHGAQYLSVNLCRELANNHGFEVDAVLLGDGVLMAEFEQAARVHRLGSRGGDAAGRDLALKLKDSGVEFAIANTTVSGLFAADLKRAGIRVVSLVHELPGVIEAMGLQENARAIARDADRVVFAGTAVRDGFERFAALDPDRVLLRTQGNYKSNRYQSEDARVEARALLRQKLGLPDDAVVVLSVGYADLRKGADLFIEIGERLVRNDERIHLVWLGHPDTGLEAKLRAQVKASGLAGHFHFPGRDPDTDPYYAGSDLYALTSREDPFPTVIMESLDVRVPVVAFAGVGGFDAMLGRAGGRLAPALDVERFAQECAALLSDPATRGRLGDEGKAVVDRDYSFPDYVRFLLQQLGAAAPRVSVIVPNYNYAHFLPERLQSIFGQTAPVHEVIVLDDASSDDSLAVLGRMALPANVHVIANARNSGSVSRQWQRGIEAATGDFVWIAEADDLADASFLEELLPAFERPDVVLAYCQSRQIGGAGEMLAPDYLDYVADFGAERWRAPFVATLAEELRHGLAVKNTIPNVSGVVFRRQALAEVMARHGDEIASYRIAGDWMTYLRLLEGGSLAFHPGALNSHRRHAAGVTIGASHRPHLEEVQRVQQWIAGKHPLADDTRRAAADYGEYLKRYFGLDAEAVHD